MQPIILLHGALGAASSLLPLSKALSTHTEVHTINFSGHGEAPWPDDAGFSIETFEADVLRYMDARCIPDAHIFGYSMGGFVGLRLAMNVPERILSLTTLATKMDWTEEACAKEAAMLNADVMEAKVPRFVAALSATHPANGWRKLVEHTQQMIGSMSRYRVGNEALAAIQQPVRLMLGDRDKMVTMDETLATYKALPNASLAILPNTPHPLEGADTELLAGLIRTHIAGVKPNSGKS